MEENTRALKEKYVLPALGRGYIAARTDTTQQFGRTPDKEVR